MLVRGSSGVLALAHPHAAYWAVPLRTPTGQLPRDMLRLVGVGVVWIGLPLLGLMAGAQAASWLGAVAGTLVVLLSAVVGVPLGMWSWAELVGPALTYHRLRADQLGVSLDLLHCSRTLVEAEIADRAGRALWQVPWEQLADVAWDGPTLSLRTHGGETHPLPSLPKPMANQLAGALMGVVRARRSATEPEGSAAARREALRQLIGSTT